MVCFIARKRQGMTIAGRIYNFRVSFPMYRYYNYSGDKYINIRYSYCSNSDFLHILKTLSVLFPISILKAISIL